MIEALRKVIKRMHYPLEVMLTCVRWYAAYLRISAIPDSHFNVIPDSVSG